MQAIEVVYEDGVFKPLKSLDLEIPEGTKIAIEIPKSVPPITSPCQRIGFTW